MLKKVIFLFILWKSLTFFFAYLATKFLAFKEFPASFITEAIYGRSLPYFVWIWGNFDGFHYISIAKYGYTVFQHAFFPLFPTLIKLLTTFNVHPVIAGQIISNLSFLGAILISLKLFTLDKKKGSLWLFGGILILFPTSFYYGAVYNDSLFLFLATSSLYFARKKSWLASCIFASLATFTRLNGLALVLPIFFEYLNQDQNVDSCWRLSNLKKDFIDRFNLSNVVKEKIYFIAFIPLSFMAYLGFTELNYESWTKVFSAMSLWNQDKVIFPLQVVFRYLKIIELKEFSNFTYQIALLEFASVILYILLLIYTFRKIRLSYWLFFAFSILIPALTGTFQGMPRYGLHLYPFFFSLFLFFQNKPKFAKVIYFTISILLLLYSLAHFSRGHFVA